MSTTKQFAATVGWDWSDKKHDLWLCPADGAKPEYIQLEQSPEALHEWAAKLRERFGGQPVAIALETSRGPALSALLVYDFITFYPVNPKALQSYRAAFTVSGAKDDCGDAILLEQYVRLHRDKLRALEPDTELTRKLAGLVENRRRLVDERTSFVNQIHSALKTYYPLAEKLLDGDLAQPLAAEFLCKWPDLASLQKAETKTLTGFFHKHNSRSAKKMQERLEAIRTAKALTTDAAIIEPTRLLVLGLAKVIRCLQQAVKTLELQIQSCMGQHPDAFIFRSQAAAGPVLAPRLLVAFGTNRERFESATQVQQFYGIAPVIRQSGQTKTVHIRTRCPKFGRQTFHELANCVLKCKSEPWARRYYEEVKKNNGGQHHAAVRALAFKLTRIYYACWKTRQPYNSKRYQRSLQKSGSPFREPPQQSSPLPCE